MNRSRPRFRWLFVLWGAAALLLVTGFTASATQQPTAAPGDTVEAEAGIGEAPLQPAPTVQPIPGERAADARAEARGGTPTERLISFIGLLTFVGIAWLLSLNRMAVRWRIVAWGMGLQFAFAAIILLTAPGRWIFEGLNDMVVTLIGYTEEGARFIFGNLVLNNVPVGPAEGPMSPIAEPEMWANTGAYFAFNVLPTIIFFSSLMTVLYYMGVMQWLVQGFAWIMRRTMGTSGSESLSAAGNIFVGQTEAPLLVKPFIRDMTQSELHAVMTGGFATVAGGVMAAYVGMLVAFFPDIAGHLIAASVMSAPAALAISKVMYPELETSTTAGAVKIEVESPDVNVIDAAARGAGEGLHLALNVAAMLLAFIALLALMNGVLGWLGGMVGWEELSLQLLLGWLGAPLALLMGVPWQDALQIGVLIGEKTALNEFVAYLHLAQMLQMGEELSPRSVVLATYALAGFANFASIAIQIGGIGGIAPERRSDLSRVGLRAMIGGTLAAFMTASVVGILL
jgi:concentrative nucleoside transporter, CNT family